jgi:hypothetical protein
MFRTDENNNPAAFTTQIAEQAGLRAGVDYSTGTPFKVGDSTFYTAKLLGDPVQLTINVITAIGYYTKEGHPRWTYICFPKFMWDQMTWNEKRDVVGFHYKNEGGTEMRQLFPNYELS